MPVDERFREAVCAAALDYLADPVMVETPRDGRSVIFAADHVIVITTDGQARDLELDSGDLTVAVEAMDLWLSLDAMVDTAMRPAAHRAVRAQVKTAREKLRARL